MAEETQVPQSQEIIPSSTATPTAPDVKTESLKTVKKYDGSTPILDVEVEEYANWLATPSSDRLDEKKIGYIKRRRWVSDNGNPNYMKLDRWDKSEEVLARVEYLLKHNGRIAKNVIKRELPAMAEAAVKRVKKTGDPAELVELAQFSGDAPEKPNSSVTINNAQAISFEQLVRESVDEPLIDPDLEVIEVPAEPEETKGKEDGSV